MVTLMTRSRVVVGVAGGSGNWQALAWAVAEAGQTGRHLVICYSCPAESPLAAPGAGARMSMLELVEPPFARAVAAARLQLGGDRVSVVVRSEPPGDLLVSAASTDDLLVVGAPEKTGWLERDESTTHYVVRFARGPVVVVRPSSGLPARSSVDRRGDATFTGHIVVGVDGSASARAALEFGFAFAAEHRRPLAAVHAAPDLDFDVWFADREGRPLAEPAPVKLLAEEVEPWQHKYPDVATRSAILADAPLSGVLRASDGALLLCVGESASGPRAVGSVTHGAVDQASCAVAVLRAGAGRAAARSEQP